MVMIKEKVDCPNCGKKVSKGNLPKHQKTKKCKNRNDKTAGKKVTTPPKSPPEADNGLLSASPAESKILKEINMNKEFENMSEKFKSGKTEEDKEKKYKYKCECGEYFNIPAKNEAGENCCPFCGK